MSNPIDGLQFPTYPKTQKVSTSRTGKEIIAEALANVDHQSSVTALTEKNWRKQYPRYFCTFSFPLYALLYKSE